MKVRKRILLIVAVCLAVLIILGYIFSPYVSAFRVNRYLDIAGVKLLMTPEQVEGILGEGSAIGGFGAEFYEYSNSAVTVAYKWDGMLSGKAGWIEISDPGYSICGVRPGDSTDKAKAILKKYGFIQDKDDMSSFKRGSARISIYWESVRISIEDWTIRGRVY